MKLSQAVLARINEILRQKDMSWSQLERESGLSKGTIICVQYARYKSISLITLVNIIFVLGLSIEEFFKSPLFEENNLDIE